MRTKTKQVVSRRLRGLMSPRGAWADFAPAEMLEPRLLLSMSVPPGLSGSIDATTPSPLSFTLSPGDSDTGSVSTTVSIVPPITGDVDVFFVVDTTGSLGSLLGSVQSTLNAIISDLVTNLPGDNFHFGAAQFKDYYDGPPFSTVGVSVDQPLTSNYTSVGAAINGWESEGGGDIPEENLSALKNVGANWLSYGGRADAQKIIIYVSDTSGWENGANGYPYPTLSSTIGALVSEGVAVYALDNDGPGGGMDQPGFSASPGGPADGRDQASAITEATGGQIFYNVDFSNPAAVSTSIENAVTTSVQTVSAISLSVSGDLGGWTVDIEGSPAIGPFSFEESPVEKDFGIDVTAPDESDSRTVTLVLSADGDVLASSPLDLSTSDNADLTDAFEGPIKEPIKPGEKLEDVALTISNIGSSPAEGQEVTTYVLYDNPDLSGSGIVLGSPSEHIDLDGGDSITETPTLEVPSTLKPGTYYLVAQVNSDGSIDEDNTDNDFATSNSLDVDRIVTRDIDLKALSEIWGVVNDEAEFLNDIAQIVKLTPGVHVETPKPELDFSASAEVQEDFVADTDMIRTLTFKIKAAIGLGGEVNVEYGLPFSLADLGLGVSAKVKVSDSLNETYTAATGQWVDSGGGSVEGTVSGYGLATFGLLRAELGVQLGVAGEITTNPDEGMIKLAAEASGKLFAEVDTRSSLSRGSLDKWDPLITKTIPLFNKELGSATFSIVAARNLVLSYLGGITLARSDE